LPFSPFSATGLEAMKTGHDASPAGDVTSDMSDIAVLSFFRDGPGLDAKIPDAPAASDLAIPDLSTSDVSDGSLASFCQGNLSQMVFNGSTSGPVVHNMMMVCDGCDAGRLEVITATLSHQIVITWRHESSPGTAYPASIGLANPPPGWEVQLIVDCDPTRGTCLAPPDSYTTGLSGTLKVSPGASGFILDLCLHVEEDAASPHPIVHSLDLYAPNIHTF
jgi:hypothetical protein